MLSLAIYKCLGCFDTSSEGLPPWRNDLRIRTPLNLVAVTVLVKPGPDARCFPSLSILSVCLGETYHLVGAGGSWIMVEGALGRTEFG